MKIKEEEKRKAKELINDLINFLNYNKELINENEDLIHYDNLKEEVKDNKENFFYDISFLNKVFNALFN